MQDIQRERKDYLEEEIYNIHSNVKDMDKKMDIRVDRSKK